jgi:dephospho-CoA kinase
MRGLAMAHAFGLSGGIATGKSTVAARWRARGLPIVDADELAREVVARGSEGLLELVAAFGPDIVGASGELNRARMARVVFEDPLARRTLEGITHPRIIRAGAERIEAFGRSGEPLVCYEAALLVERGRARELRPLVIVTAPERAQIERAMTRSTMGEDEVRARIRAQLPLEDKVSVADFVIDNDGDSAALDARADDVLDAVCRRVGVDPSRYRRG